MIKVSMKDSLPTGKELGDLIVKAYKKISKQVLDE